MDRVFKLQAQQRKINSFSLIPKQKNRLKMTASSEIGWYCEPLVPKNDLQVNGLKQTAVTQYVSAYVLQYSINPFHKDVHCKR